MSCSPSLWDPRRPSHAWLPWSGQTRPDFSARVAGRQGSISSYASAREFCEVVGVRNLVVRTGAQLRERRLWLGPLQTSNQSACAPVAAPVSSEIQRCFHPGRTSGRPRSPHQFAAESIGLSRRLHATRRCEPPVGRRAEGQLPAGRPAGERERARGGRGLPHVSSNPRCSNLSVNAFSETVRTFASSKPSGAVASISIVTFSVTPGVAPRGPRISSASFLKSDA